VIGSIVSIALLIEPSQLHPPSWLQAQPVLFLGSNVMAASSSGDPPVPVGAVELEAAVVAITVEALPMRLVRKAVFFLTKLA
jgi:hypothetical protein